MKRARLFFDIFYALLSFTDPYNGSKLKSQLPRKIKYIKDDTFNAVLSVMDQYNESKILESQLKDDKTNLQRSALWGHFVCILYFAKKDKKNMNIALEYTALGGHIGICKRLLDLNINFTAVNLALCNAALAGHLNICEEMLKFGATNVTCAIIWAAHSGWRAVCKGLIRLSAIDINWYLANAASEGFTEACAILIELGARNINWAIYWAKDEKTKIFLKKFLSYV